jgi:hypothetical protein
VPFFYKHRCIAMLFVAAGLERLYVDLYEDLLNLQQGTTLGQFLLYGLTGSQQQQMMYLHAKYTAIMQEHLNRAFKPCRAPAEVVEAAVFAVAAATRAAARQMPPPAAAAAGRGADCSDCCHKGIGQLQLGDGNSGGSADAHAGAAGSSGGCARRRRTASGSGTAAVAAAAGPSEQVAADTAPNAAAASTALVPVPAAAAAGAVAVVVPAHLPHLKPENMRFYDKQHIGWFLPGKQHHSTALVGEIVVSRAGHFTCPVHCGAVLLAQLPPSYDSSRSRNSSSSSAAGTASSSNASLAIVAAAGGSGGMATAAGAAGVGDVSGVAVADSQQRRDQDEEGQGLEGLAQLVMVSEEPYSQVLKDMETGEAVVAASSAGRLPPVLQHVRLPGQGEWIEFAPLGEEERRRRKVLGLMWRPVVWFR